MRGSFKPLVSPGSHVSEVGLEGTRAERERPHQDIRLRQHVAWLMEHCELDSETVRVTPFELVSTETPADVERDEAG